MRNRIFKVVSIVAGIVFAAILYVNSSYHIENQEWKYSDGNWIGDWLSKGTRIENRIVYGNRGKAKIVYCFMGKLIIENIETGERGIYTNKS